MRVAIISDTHANKHISRLEELLYKNFNDMDYIIHAGDFTNTRVVNLFMKHKHFTGVWGNVDDDSVREILNEREIIKLNGYRIGVFHGHGEKKTTIDRAYDKFKDDRVDVIIFGHSHQPLICTKKKTLMINPGSPMNKHRERWYSYAVLDLNRDYIDARIRFW